MKRVKRSLREEKGKEDSSRFLDFLPDYARWVKISWAVEQRDVVRGIDKSMEYGNAAISII